MRKYAWSVVILVGGYIGLQLIADIGATRIVDVWGFAIPGGTFVFALTFTWRDALHKRLGKEWARAAILIAGAINLLMAGYFAWIGTIGVPVFIPQEVANAWVGIFAFVPAIVAGSILAEVTSEWIDTEVYHRLIDRFRGKMQFVRVLGSNAISLPIDSLIFASLAFVLIPPIFGGEPMPWGALPPIILGQIVFKALVTVISLPLIYVIPDQEESEERWLDEMFIREQAEDFEGGAMGSANARIGDEF